MESEKQKEVLMVRPRFNQPQKINYLSHFISGLSGSILSVTLCHPLEITRTRLNLQVNFNFFLTFYQRATKQSNKYKGVIHTLQTVFIEEGFGGFYKGYNIFKLHFFLGYNATAISIPIFYSLFFCVYNKSKTLIEDQFLIKGFKNHLLASIVSGGICDFITNPLWLIRTRMQTQYLHGTNKYQTVYQSLQTIYREEGFFAYYKGFSASLIGLSHAAIQFPVYEQIKQYLQDQHEGQLRSVDILIASILSKSLACILTYPHILLRTRLFDNASSRLSILKLIQFILQKEGIKGFYHGLPADLIRLIPMNSITFLVYEKMNTYLNEFF